MLDQGRCAQGCRQGVVTGPAGEARHDGEVTGCGGLVEDGGGEDDLPVLFGHGGGTPQNPGVEAGRGVQPAEGHGKRPTVGGEVSDQPVEQVGDGLRDAPGGAVQGVGQAVRTTARTERVVGHPADGVDVERPEDMPYHCEGGRELGVGSQGQPRLGEFLGAVAQDAREVSGRGGEQSTQACGVGGRRAVHVLGDEQHGAVAGRRPVGGRPVHGLGPGRREPMQQAALAGPRGTLDQQQDGASGPVRVERRGEPSQQRGLDAAPCSGVRHGSSPRFHTHNLVVCVSVLSLP
ncbi:hypothetical protein ACN6LA_006295 [Streptomyces sp. SAS_269]|uniref:hypothetical protein n=1 Tax=Streptomyces sp. SAS_269 TaxID=3412749 RepID=UPI00403D2775